MLLDESLSVALRAARFHGALAATAREISRAMRDVHGVEIVGLAGGVFQNRLLAETVLGMLRADGLSVRLGRQIPCNDAGLSFGQMIEFGARK